MALNCFPWELSLLILMAWWEQGASMAGSGITLLMVWAKMNSRNSVTCKGIPANQIWRTLVKPAVPVHYFLLATQAVCKRQFLLLCWLYGWALSMGHCLVSRNSPPTFSKSLLRTGGWGQPCNRPCVRSGVQSDRGWQPWGNTPGLPGSSTCPH